jgi:hypothetical protein
MVKRRTNTTMVKRRTNNDLQNTMHKTIDWGTRTPLKTELSVPAPLVTPVVLLLN